MYNMENEQWLQWFEANLWQLYYEGGNNRSNPHTTGSHLTAKGERIMNDLEEKFVELLG